MSVVSMYGIMMHFQEYPKAVRRGEIAIKSNHVVEIKYAEGRIVGKVKASQRKVVYAVEAYANDDGTVSSTRCECARRYHLCHHVAALLLKSMSAISKTDKPCEWNRAAAPTDETHPVTFYYPTPMYRPLKHPINNEDRQFFREQLSKNGIICGFTWLLADEPKVTQLPVPLVDDILADPAFLASSNQCGFFLNRMAVTVQQVRDVEKNTLGQRDNVVWGLYRKGRITASNFGKVIKAATNGRQPPRSLFKSLLGEYDFSGLRAIQWGVHHKEVAVKRYEEFTGNKVTPAGLVLDPTGLLGASPDGYVEDDIVLEVKCPWSVRECASIDEALATKDFFLVQEGDVLSLAATNQAQAYKHQIQGQLALTGRNTCHFVVWAPAFMMLIVIPSDPLWTGNLQILKDFYVNHFFQVLTAGIGD